MLLSALPHSLSSAPDSVRLRLMASLYAEHSPELADLVESAELELTNEGLWIRPELFFRELSPAWFETALVRAACEAALPNRMIRPLASASDGGQLPAWNS